MFSLLIKDLISDFYFKSFRKRRKFIVAQTPLPSAVVDFLSLIYQEKCTCVVSMEEPDIQVKVLVSLNSIEYLKSIASQTPLPSTMADIQIPSHIHQETFACVWLDLQDKVVVSHNNNITQTYLQEDICLNEIRYNTCFALTVICFVKANDYPVK